MRTPRPRFLLFLTLICLATQWRAVTEWLRYDFPHLLDPSETRLDDAPFPWPRSYQRGAHWARILHPKLSIKGAGLAHLSKEEIKFIHEWFAQYAEEVEGDCKHLEHIATITEIEVQLTSATPPPWGEDERYEIEHSAYSPKLFVRGASVRAVLWAVRTLSALGFKGGCAALPSPLRVADAPRLGYRGLLVDTARNRLSVAHLKRVVRFMSHVKLNVLHWHFEDDTCFSLALDALANARHQPWTYTKDEVRDIVQYAKSQGVRVVPEFNPVSHATALMMEDPSLVTLCPTWACIYGWSMSVDIFSNKTIDKLVEILTELFDLFPDEIYHLGGDELSVSCWLENDSAREAIERRIGHIPSYVSLHQNVTPVQLVHNWGMDSTLLLSIIDRLERMTLSEYLALNYTSLVALGYNRIEAAKYVARARREKWYLTAEQQVALDLLILERLAPLYRLLRAHGKKVMVWHDGWSMHRPAGIDGPDFVTMWAPWWENGGLFRNDLPITSRYDGYIYAHPWYLDVGCATWAECYHADVEPNATVTTATATTFYAGASASAFELGEAQYAEHGVLLRLAAAAGGFWSERGAVSEELKARRNVTDENRAEVSPRWVQTLLWLDTVLNFSATPIRNASEARRQSTGPYRNFYRSSEFFRGHVLAGELMCALMSAAAEGKLRRSEAEAAMIVQFDPIFEPYPGFRWWHEPGIVEIHKRVAALPWVKLRSQS